MRCCPRRARCRLQCQRAHEPRAAKLAEAATRAQKLRKQLREARSTSARSSSRSRMNVGVEIMAPPGMEEMGQQLRADVLSRSPAARRQKRKLTIEAGAPAADRGGSRQAGQRGRDPRRTRSRPASRTASSSSTRSTRSPSAREGYGADVSREGVQRDLLPLVEGSTVSAPSTAPVKTDHILFIASGAFHLAKPSDLIPEMQGRFPIRVELAALTQGRLRAHPDRAASRADHAVHGAAEDRRRDAEFTAERRRAPRRDRRSRSTSAPRTSARAACTR